MAFASLLQNPEHHGFLKKGSADARQCLAFHAKPMNPCLYFTLRHQQSYALVDNIVASEMLESPYDTAVHMPIDSLPLAIGVLGRPLLSSTCQWFSRSYHLPAFPASFVSFCFLRR